MAIQKIPNTLIADNAVTAAKIANGSLTADDISNNSITAAKISASTSPTFASLTTTGVLNNFSTGSSWGTGLTLTNTNDDASPALLTFKKAPASGHTTMADNDYIGFMNFRADNSNNDEHSWVELAVLANDITDGSEDSTFRVTTWGGGTEYANTLVAASGKVGIGTSSPYHTFDVFGDVIANGQAKSNGLFFDTTSATTGTGGGIALGGYSNGTGGAVYHFGNIQGIKENSTAGNYASAMLFSTRANGATPTEKMRIDSSGNVGIGLAPSGNLTAGYVARLYGGTQTYIAFNNSTHTTQVTGGFVIGNDGGAARITQRENQPMVFDTNNTEAMRIDSSGNVGIAAIPSGEAAAAHVVRLGDRVCIGEYDDGSNPEQFNLFHNSDSSETYIETGSASVIQQRAGEIIFKNAASGSAGAAISFAERMRIKSDGQITTQGDILPGADVIMANGRGISFTATANSSGSMSSELLDDYEEGTWTPACGATLATAVGHYTKIGNQVTVHYHIVSTGGLPTSTSQVIITGLPFTSNSSVLTAAPIYARYYTPNDSTLTSVVQDSETQIRLININDSNFDYTVWGALEASSNNSIYIIGSATYMV